jgi:PST family polysaccharide transporter
MTNQTLSGLFWTSLATAAHFILLLLVLVVLARLLTPADFGLATAALMAIGFSAIFSQLGIGPAVVQRADLQTAHLRSGFTLSVLLGVLLAVLTWVTAPAVAAFFRLEGLTPLLRALSLIFPLQGLAVVAESLLQRELRFRCLAALDVITIVLGYGVVGITLAALGFAAWALVGAHLAQTVLRTILLLFIRPHPAWPLLERRACAELLYFGGGFTAGRLSNYLAGQGEHLVIGRCLGAVALGVYGRAYQLMAGPAVLFGNVLDRVLFPVMSHVQGDAKRLADAYRRGTALVALVILPLSAVLVLLAPETVLVVLGAEWQAVTVPFQILGVGMLFRTGCKISDALVRATGAVYSRTWRQTAYAVLVLVGAWIGQPWGVEGVALAVLATLAINCFLMAQLSLHEAAMSWSSFGAAHLPGLALAVLVGVPVGVTAEVARAWELSPWLVLLAGLAAILPCLIVVRSLPGLFLGHDGQWMARKLRAFLFGPAPNPRLTKETSMTDVRNESSVAEPWLPSSNGNGVHLSRGGGPLRRLTRDLASAGVRYCRWKRSLDLERVLCGKGDLDLLVDCQDAEAFLRVADQLGFRRVVSCFEPRRDQEIHLYGLDPETGALLHLHVNLSLLGDESPLNDGSPSLEELVLHHAAPGTAPGLLEGMPVVQPPAELIVFVLRTMQQYARLGAYPLLAGKRKTIQARLQALLAEEGAADWRKLLDAWLPSVPPDLFAECLAALRDPSPWWRRLRLARQLRKRLQVGRAFSLRATVGRMLSFMRAGAWRLCHGRGSPKQLPSGGAVIAFIGPEACGKSTMVAETTRWLGNVFRVQSAHLGKPPATWLTLLPTLAWKLLRRAVPRLRAQKKSAGERTAGPGKPGLLRRLGAVLLAWDRRALARRLARKAARGWLVVCDRYPTAVVGAPDSARLPTPEGGEGPGWFRAPLARLENRLYRGIHPPHIVIRLNAPLTVAIDRNKERIKAGKESDAYVTRRHRDFFVPQFANARTIELDSNRSQAETVQAVRRLLWELL